MTVEARGHGLWGICGAGPTQAEEQRRVKQPLYVVCWIESSRFGFGFVADDDDDEHVAAKGACPGDWVWGMRLGGIYSNAYTSRLTATEAAVRAMPFVGAASTKRPTALGRRRSET